MCALLPGKFLDPALLPSPAVGVGSKDPKTFAAMTRADRGRREHLPFRIEPEIGQSPENDVKPASNKNSHVLHEDVGWLRVANDPEHVEPETRARARQASSVASNADVLAREAAADDVDTLSPGGTVEGSDVVMDREARQRAVLLASLQDRATVGVDLDRADAAVAEQFACQDPTTDASEQVQFAHGS